MNIHVEKDVKTFKDRQLLVRLLSYAKPYWRMVLFCIFLSFLIVVADLARLISLKWPLTDTSTGYINRCCRQKLPGRSSSKHTAA